MRLILRSIAWLGVPIGFLLFGLGVTTLEGFFRWVLIVLGLVCFGLGLLVDYWYLRSNRAQVRTDLLVETWYAVNNDWHNSNTDMIFWDDHFYLVHAASPFHFASQKCSLILYKSKDAHAWEKIREFSIPKEDIRDPKFAPIDGKLFLYALANRSIDPEPYTTIFTYSLDGISWEPFENIKPEGWLFWRPKSKDARTWYVPAYWWEHGKSILMSTIDGINWQIISTIYEGDRNDETDIEFLADGRMISTARLEFSINVFGDKRGCTLVSLVDPPYQVWEQAGKFKITRLDGPCLFNYHDRVYAVGRFQPNIQTPFTWQGSVVARKRTSLFLIEETGLKYLSDLPSAGDTSYAGVVVKNQHAYICYYTSNIDRDYPWIVGMLEPSPIAMVKVDLNKLEALALSSPELRKA